MVMKPVVVDGAEVAGAEPPVDHRLGGGLGVVEVAGEDVVPADDDLAELARPAAARSGRRPLGGDLHLDAPDRVADGAGRVPNPGWLVVAVGEVSDRP